jgi:[ribosomal protein S18]-alanine N-acetyltransferase
MIQGLTIREAGLADFFAIWEIEKLSFPTPWSRWSFLMELTQPHSHSLVAGPAPSQPWQTWGYLIYWVVADEMHILNLAVHPSRRRQGIARELLAKALREARDQGVATAWLEVRPSNAAALALYASFGFREVGRRRGYYEDTGEEAILLALTWEEEDHGPKPE